MTFALAATQLSRFTSEALAVGYAEREANRWIVLGDNGEYWVTTYRVASWLVRNGYALHPTCA